MGKRLPIDVWAECQFSTHEPETQGLPGELKRQIWALELEAAGANWSPRHGLYFSSGFGRWAAALRSLPLTRVIGSAVIQRSLLPSRAPRPLPPPAERHTSGTT